MLVAHVVDDLAIVSKTLSSNPTCGHTFSYKVPNFCIAEVERLNFFRTKLISGGKKLLQYRFLARSTMEREAT